MFKNDELHETLLFMKLANSTNKKNMIQMTWLKLLNRITFFFWLFGAIGDVKAQTTLTDYKNTYPNYNEIVINDQQSYKHNY
jgi:hypothetical protein